MGATSDPAARTTTTDTTGTKIAQPWGPAVGGLGDAIWVL
jgi:hypothetical protein